jgi:leucyl aminopeptidase
MSICQKQKLLFLKHSALTQDASGIAVIMAIMRILKTSGYQGAYAIEAHAYAGEEGGLLGSQNIASLYKARNKTVRGMLNFEMIGKLTDSALCFV